jgi:uncharacterized lipoprotein YddW (UPF0748 family)
MGLPPAGQRRVAEVAAVAVFAVLAIAAGAVTWRSQLPVERPATLGVAGSCAGRPLAAPRQLRGMTITTVSNMDWPSRPGLDMETAKAEYRSWLDLAQRLNFNAVFVHIRPSGDALWPSQFTPWSQWLTGRTDGQGPGWDPLRFMVDETHARNLEFHAWFNPYRASVLADVNQLPPNHPLRLHPEWGVVYPVNTSGSRLYYNPGVPDARHYVEDSVLDAVKRYDLDAVFFDDYFYPYPTGRQDFADEATFMRYGEGFASKADWRRNNVNLLVQEMSQRIKALKPWVKFGISPFGIWRNADTDPKGSDTRGLQSYDEIYADSLLWIKREWLDYVIPQLYWQIGLEVADYAKLVPWWSKAVAGTRVQLYIALGDYRVGQKGVWSDPGELDRQLELNRGYPVSGTVHFSARDVRADRLGSVTRYREAHYASPALVPPMPQLPASALAAPTTAGVRRNAAGVTTVTWRSGGSATGFAIYRVDETDTGPARLVATTRNTGRAEQVWVDRSAAVDRVYSYCVTALDRNWRESDPSAPA